MEVNLSKNMEQEVVLGERNPYQQRNTSLDAVESTDSAIMETGKIKTGVSDAVKKLELGDKEMFPDKDEVAETTIVEDAANNNSKKTLDNSSSKKILGMTPLVFGLALVGVSVVSYFAYQNFGKKALKAA